MRFLYWRVERANAGSAKTKVRIELKRAPNSYSYQWTVVDKQTRRLSKRELHELDMRVAKYVSTLVEPPPQNPEERTLHTSLQQRAYIHRVTVMGTTQTFRYGEGTTSTRAWRPSLLGNARHAETEKHMRSISQWLADTFSTQSQVRLKITSSGRQFAVFAIPGYTLRDSRCVGKHWVSKANKLEPTICQYKTALEEVRRDQNAASHDTLMKVMPDVVAYVRTLGERASVRTEQHFVVYL